MLGRVSFQEIIDECIIDVAEFLDPGIVERTNKRFDSEEDFLNYVTAGFSGKIAKQYRAKPFSKEYWQAFSDALQDVVTVGVPAYKEYIAAKKGIVDVSTKTVSSSKKSWIKNTWNKIKNKAKKILSKDKSISTTDGSVDIQLFGKETGEAGIGLYKDVKGHHIHAKAAFKGHVSYDLKKGLSISQDFMKSKGWSHSDMTTKQRQLFKELFESGRPNTLNEHTRIAIESLKAGGATLDEATQLVNKSIKNLVEQGVDAPTRIPWYTK